MIQFLLFLYYQQQPTTNNQYVLARDEQQSIQRELDSLRLMNAKKKDTIYPFNPNYITDYKGYILELTPVEIDRILVYRSENQYINSAQEFQQLTGVSNRWMEKYERYFIFGNRYKKKTATATSRSSTVGNQSQTRVSAKDVRDINVATATELQEIHGIGPVLSKRILDDRDRWGGYVHMDQVKFVYGLSQQVVESILLQFAVLTPSAKTPIDLNNSTINDLKNIPYLNYYLAREIVKYRSLHGDFVNKEQLKEIEKIPLDKIDIISLYLEIRN
ncbi:ComEA family DNA-binding protein [Myroides fluvii]|uniref:ComEA family DNA-binding protein n=1 Tax=Myroides fluvii TaxID=2572594 RepID=UPI001E5A3695|nr:helix-hairpin-helix domain-containing protein [Myroides fluvii]